MAICWSVALAHAVVEGAHRPGRADRDERRLGEHLPDLRCALLGGAPRRCRTGGPWGRGHTEAAAFACRQPRGVAGLRVPLPMLRASSAASDKLRPFRAEATLSAIYAGVLPVA